MYIVIVFLMVVSGVVSDAWQVTFKPTSDQWQVVYSSIRDLQFIGFALLAFELCPYKRVEFKVMTFFLIVFRIFVCVANLVHAKVEWSLAFVSAMALVYVIWLSKSAGMTEHEPQEEQEGAYYFLMPIHSMWGILKAVFMPWLHARYESVVLVQGDLIWAVHRRHFVVRSTHNTDLSSRAGVKRYIGRDLTSQELVKLNSMVGKRAIPGVRDCRRLRVV